MWVQVVMMVIQMAMAASQAAKQKKAAQAAAQRQASQVQKEQWAAYEKAEKNRKDALKKGLAKKRAKFGASGFSSADGSAGAIVQGMRTDAAEGSFEDYNTAKENVDESMSAIQSNLLEQSDQSNRKLYGQVGQAAGSLAGSLMEEKKKKEKETNEKTSTSAGAQ